MSKRLSNDAPCGALEEAVWGEEAALTETIECCQRSPATNSSPAFPNFKSHLPQ